MDLNPIDLKIKQFALYLKDFGLLNETNINDFLKKFKNVSENSIMPSGIFETDINVGLIYLKENLSKTMLEFYDLMTEERKKITYLNIYSKFLKKREDELQTKGNKIYNLYTSHMIKQYFSYWKNKDESNKNDKFINNNNNKNKSCVNINKKKDNISSSVIQDFKKDNFCFDIMSNDQLSNSNNVIINSNNNRIYLVSNRSTNYNRNDISNNNNDSYNMNTFLLSSKTKSKRELKNFYDNKSYDMSKKNQQLFENKKDNYNNNGEKILNKLFHQPIRNKIEENNDYFYLDNSISKSIAKSYNSSRHSVNPQMKIKNVKNNNNVYGDNNYYNKYCEKEIVNQKYNNKTIKMRNTYSSSRPKSSLNYSDNNNTNKSVYQRLYDQNKEKIKRQEERIKENMNKIKERANHPIQRKTNSINNFRNNKKNKIINNENNGFNHNIYNHKYKITYEGEKPNFSDKNYVSKKIDEALFSQTVREKSKYIENKKDYNINDEQQKRKNGKNFIESQRKCIGLFNDMIEMEEKRGNKIFNEIEKERMFKDLLNKLYEEMNNNNNNKINDNEDEDEKINDDNVHYNQICDSVEMNLNNN